jgi:hypothetical protein
MGMGRLSMKSHAHAYHAYHAHRVRVKIASLILFLVMFVVFALVYQHVLDPEDFHWPEDITNRGPSFVDYLYFSCSTLATVGYGDIYPQTERARGWLIFQQVMAVCILSFLIIV